MTYQKVSKNFFIAGLFRQLSTISYLLFWCIPKLINNINNSFNISLHTQIFIPLTTILGVSGNIFLLFACIQSLEISKNGLGLKVLLILVITTELINSFILLSIYTDVLIMGDRRLSLISLYIGGIDYILTFPATLFSVIIFLRGFDLKKKQIVKNISGFLLILIIEIFRNILFIIYNPYISTYTVRDIILTIILFLNIIYTFGWFVIGLQLRSKK